MKMSHSLSNDWQIRAVSGLENTVHCTEKAARSLQNIPDTEWIRAEEPLPVQEILLAHGKIDASILETGETDKQDYRWIARTDWVYRCRFHVPPGERYTLLFQGLDTVADIFLNGRFLARSQSSYLPLHAAIKPQEGLNSLLIYFHSPFKLMQQIEQGMPPEERGKIEPRALLRKSAVGFGDYFGCKNEWVPIGVFGSVLLKTEEGPAIEEFSVQSSYLTKEKIGQLTAGLSANSCAQPVRAMITVFGPDGETAARQECALQPDSSGCARPSFVFNLQNPCLWWPVHYGEQPLYRVEAVLLLPNGKTADHEQRQVGFREITQIGDFRFQINGRPLKLWGANLAPLWGFSLREKRERLETLLSFILQGNMNILRIWGPGQPYGDFLYEEADRRGLLIWQDFPVEGFAYLPSDPRFRRLVLQEAAYMVRRLRHHPSILLWSGGNETMLTADWRGADGLCRRQGERLLSHDLRRLCLGLDKQRLYTTSCPSGGRYANDPSGGDCHGGNCIVSYLPGEDYPVFLSETIKTFPPNVKSLKRFIPAKDLWPEGYRDERTYTTAQNTVDCDPIPDPMPPGWMRRGTNYMKRKNGPIQNYYDAHDPESLVYRIAMAAAEDYRSLIGRCRQGRPFYEAHLERRSEGCMIWKLNDTWPQIYCALIDYYLEPTIPYYAVRRAYAPFSLILDVEGHAHVWGVNDSMQDYAGTLELFCFDPFQNAVTVRQSLSALVRRGESVLLGDFDSFGPIRRENLLYARFLDEQGHTLSRDIAFLDIERNILFPPARLTLSLEEDGSLSLQSDRFARSVILSGEEDGDTFGWYFEDNYFDLLPFEKKRVRLTTVHSRGVLSARAYYSPESTTAVWEKSTFRQN